MTPAARVQAAIEALDQIVAGEPAEKVLTSWARGARYAGSKDRAAVRDHVYQVLRCKRSYAALGGGEDGRALVIGSLRAAGTSLEDIFSGVGHAPAPLSKTELERCGEPGSLAERADLPAWLWERFEVALGTEQAMEAGLALRERAPVCLRVNEKLSTVKQAIEKLREYGIDCCPLEDVNAGLIVMEGARRIAESQAYQHGLVELQDASSQAAMEHLQIADGARVLDFCAGGGGKTLALAARVDATWYAHDAYPARMRDLPDRARRAQVLVEFLDQGAVSQKAPFDVVLCDVPCSGSGTWRRTPDAKWRLNPAAFEDLKSLQRQILLEADALVIPQGQLVYATCSVLQEENEEQIEWFLSRSSNWKVSAQKSWPVSAQGDGFFLTCLQRV